ncbi:hypothetical protein SLA2020_063580 [Shorea laevis]
MGGRVLIIILMGDLGRWRWANSGSEIKWRNLLQTHVQVMRVVMGSRESMSMTAARESCVNLQMFTGGHPDSLGLLSLLDETIAAFFRFRILGKRTAWVEWSGANSR